MIERVTRHFGRLVFDRDAIVRAALRAYVETYLNRISRFCYRACFRAADTGPRRRPAGRVGPTPQRAALAAVV